MPNVIEQDTVAAPVQVRTQDRRRAGRVANPSPQLIALMRAPTDDARRRLALYDAPNFMPQQAPRAPVNPMHLARVVGAIGISVVAWGALFGTMMVAWG